MLKFRAEKLDGEIIYSDSVVFEKEKGEKIPFLRGEDRYWYEVKSESLALFVGRDLNGREVYNGDKLRCIFDKKYEVEAELYWGDAATKMLLPIYELNDLVEVVDDVGD